MTRTFFLLAALALVPGCYSSTYCGDPGTMTFYWRFRGLTGAIAGEYTTANPGCTINGVSYIDSVQVTVDGVAEAPVNCTTNGVPGIQLPGFLGGNHTWRVDALRGNRVIFTQSGTASTRACGDTQVSATLEAVSPADLVVYYDVPNRSLAGCKLGGISITQVSFELRDAANRIVDASCAARSPPVTGACTQEASNACDPVSLGFTAPSLPLGSYTMNYLELWDFTNRPMAQICAGDPGSSFVHDGFPVFLNLAASSGQFCPGNYPASALAASTPAAP